MTRRNLLETVISAILVLAASSAAVLGQNKPTDYPLLTGNGEDSPPPFSELPADQSQSASRCDEGCCQSCSCPRWTASADFIILDRLGGANQMLVQGVAGFSTSDRFPGSKTFGELFTAPGLEALNSNDFQQGFAAGPRVGLIRHGDSGYDLELSYFQVDGWRSDRTVEPNGPDDCLVMKAPGHWLSPTTSQNGWLGWIQTNQSATQAMAWQYASKLDNAEFNVRWNPSSRITMLAGLRWVYLGENLQGALSPPTVAEPPFWSTTTSNNLYGFQIGADGKILEHGRFSIDGLLKAGIFDNNAEDTTLVSVIHKTVYPGSIRLTTPPSSAKPACTASIKSARLFRSGPATK